MKIIYKSSIFIVLAVYLLLVLASGLNKTFALSAKQKNVLNAGAIYYDTDGCAGSSDDSDESGGIYIVGDSLTVGMRDVGGLQEKLEEKGWEVAEIEATNGDTIQRALPKIEADSEKIASVGTIVVSLGTNTEDNFPRKIDSMIQKIEQHNADANIIWINVVDLGGDPATTINRTIQSKSGQHGFTVMDWNAEINSRPNRYQTVDGLHQTPEGYRNRSQWTANQIGDAPEAGASDDSSSPTTTTGGSADIQRATGNLFDYNEIDPTSIVLHWTAGGYDNPNSLINTLRSRVERPDYPHGRAVQLTVDTEGNAYQLSESLKTKPIQTVPGGENGDWNMHSIGIEIETDATSVAGAKAELLGNEVQYQKVLVLVKQLMTQFGIENVQNAGQFKGIFGHHEINPGNSDPSPEYMQKIRGDLEGFEPGDGVDSDALEANCECSATGGGVGLEELDGHRIPATTGGAGNEEPINASGQVPSGGSVTFAKFASKGQAYQDFYITMRWRYAKWAWTGSTTDGPEDVAWYSQEPRKVLVTNPETGKSIIAAVLEAGPAPWTGTPDGDSSSPPSYWQGYIDGTPAEYNGRVAGFPPAAVAALEMEQWTYGGPEAGGGGHELQYGWASDQSATPGPVGGGSGSASTGGSSSSTSSGSSSSCGGITGDTGPNPNVQSDPSTECTGGPKPGTVELSEYIMGRWNARNLGIYNCRSVRGGSSLSLHAEGRAFDAGLLVSDADEKRRGDELFMWAIVNAANIGAQEIIWNHEIWTPSQGLHAYTGENPHTDHVHIGQNDAGAAGRTPFYTSGAGR